MASLAVLALPAIAFAAPTVTINEGASWTRTTSVTVALDGADGYTHMFLTNTAKCETFVEVAASTSWELK